MRNFKRGQVVAVVLGMALIGVACSSDDDDSTASTDAAVVEPADTTATSNAPETSASASTPSAADVGTVGGSGCGIPHGPYEQDGEPTGEVRVAWNEPLLSFNTASARGFAAANANPVYLMQAGGFSYYDDQLNYINNDQFGTCTVESLDPLSVTYRVNEGVTWDDGTQVDAADLILYWGATSTHFNSAETVVAPDGVTAESDAAGLPVVLDTSGAEMPDAEVPYDPDGNGELPEGYTYKPSAGISFDAAVDAQQLVSELPTISDDGLAATFTYDSFYVDYQLSAPIPNVPAHVVAAKALGVDDPAAAKQAIIDAFANDDAEALKPISEFWNTGFDATSLPDDPDLYLGYGPYRLTAYDELTTMTFEANPDYTWGPKPKTQTIVYTVIADPKAAVQSMKNEEVDIIQPQATADILTELSGLADRGVEVITGNAGTYEHFDLVMDNGGPFDAATYGGDADTALKVRQAFLKTIPREDIVTRLIKPLNPDAGTRDSFTTVVGAPAYDTIVAQNGSDAYAEVDIDGAKDLLEEAGVTTPVDVRVLFAADNPRRATEYGLIAESAELAGFNVIDGRSPTWGQELSSTSLYDASLFGFQSTAVAVSDSEAQFATDGQTNYGGYSSTKVDELYDQLKASTDRAEQEELLIAIETQLWSDAFGVTLFQHPGVTAFNSTYATGVSTIPLSPTIFWNVWEWEAA